MTAIQETSRKETE
jgi:hypothetical protein